MPKNYIDNRGWKYRVMSGLGETPSKPGTRGQTIKAMLDGRGWRRFRGGNPEKQPRQTLIVWLRKRDGRSGSDESGDV